MVDVIQDKTDEMARGMAQQADDAIASAIVARIGEFDVEVFDFSRLQVLNFEGGVQQMMLDGEPLIELHPITFENVYDGFSHKVVATRNYRILSNG